MKEIIKEQNCCDKNNDNVICYDGGMDDIISLLESTDNCQGVCHLVTDLRGLNDVYRDIADEIGLENALIIYRMFHGTQVSFPNKLFSKEYTYKAIISEFDGSNLSQLAQKYNYSDRSIRRILKSEKNLGGKQDDM